ncbi:MAG: glycosyltransferase family 4 protein [Candidatus Odyssella sp.]|nr:glycosyltransferase family 4 protein [Candidatus Odyssella sp.]
MVAGKNPAQGMGGGASYLRVHARAALEAGFDPHIFYAAPVGRVVRHEYGYLHEARSLFANRFAKSQGIEINKCLLPLLAPRVAAAIADFLATRKGPHLIHGFSAWGYTALLAREKLRRAGADAVVVNSVYTTAVNECRIKAAAMRGYAGRAMRAASRLEYAVTKRVIARCEGRIFAESRLVALNYDAVHRLFLESYGPVANVRKLPYAAETAFLREDDKLPPEPPAIAALAPRDAPLIVSVSRHDPRKGIDVLLRAMAELRAKGVRFRACLTSGGMLIGQHRRLAARLGIADAVAFTDWVPDAFPYLRHADVFALPSLQEASGSLSLLEALQAGAAVVASGIDGILEDVTDGDNGLLARPGDARSLGGALERVLTDAALRARLRRRARETFVEKFSAAAFTDALGSTYADLLAESTERR